MNLGGIMTSGIGLSKLHIRQFLLFFGNNDETKPVDFLKKTISSFHIIILLLINFFLRGYLSLFLINSITNYQKQATN